MAKYTDEQIKEAECPLNDTYRQGSCINKAISLLFDLINHQEAEKAELKDRIKCQEETNKHLSNEYIALLKKCNCQEAEIAELNSDLTLLKNDYEQCKSVYYEEKAKVAKLNDKLITAYKLLKSAKSEAIKEFAERLKEKAVTHNCRFHGVVYDITAVNVENIDNLVKEMVGESNV